MTIGDWLASREPMPPTELSERLGTAIADWATAGEMDIPRQLLAAAMSMMQDMLASGTTGREAALDLLTIDALVTYAYEAAAELPDAGRALAIGGMARLSGAESTLEWDAV